MSNSLIPYSFTPGTKAKAQEVNANFIALADKIEENDSAALHPDTATTISGSMTFTKPILSTVVQSVTGGNLVATNLADGKNTDLAVAMNGNDVRCGSLRVVNGNGYNEAMMLAATEDGVSAASLGVRNTDGVSYGFAPTYSTNYADNSTKIVTTAYMANHWITSKPSTTSTASTARPAVIKTNYLNGTSWYRIYTDGFIEQGGVATPNTTVKVTKAFTTTNYTVCLTSRNNSTNANYFNLAVNSITTSGFTIYHTGTGSTQIYWYACGY